VVFYQTQHVAMQELIAQLQAAPSTETRENVFTAVRETEVPEAYREPVSRYFEELSRQKSSSQQVAP
jgi:hypothetical protein